MAHLTTRKAEEKAAEHYRNYFIMVNVNILLERGKQERLLISVERKNAKENIQFSSRNFLSFLIVSSKSLSSSGGGGGGEGGVEDPNVLREAIASRLEPGAEKGLSP